MKVTLTGGKELLRTLQTLTRAFPEEAAAALYQEGFALDALGELTGETTSEDILNRIFEKFCIGK